VKRPAATGDSKSNEGEDRGVEPQMTEPFRKPSRWLPVILLTPGLLWGGCRIVEPLYQDLPASTVAGDAASTADTHILQVGELLTVHFPGMQNPPQPHEERIKEDGTITLPLIGPLVVAGKTRDEVQELLQGKYAAGIRPLNLHQPRRARVYFVGGEVRSRGPREYLGKTTVTTAIQAAGDFTESADKKKVVLIRADGRRETINLTKTSGGPNHDPLVHPGDKIEVMRKWWH